MLNIEAVSTTNAFAVGIRLVDGGDRLNFTDVTIAASDSSVFTYGASITNSSPTLSDVTIIAVGEGRVRGVSNFRSSPILFNVTVQASGGTDNVAIYNHTNSSPRLARVISTAGAGITSDGIYSTNGSNPIIKNSELSGFTYSLFNDDTSSARVLFSRLDGPVSGDGLTCIGCLHLFDNRPRFFISSQN